MDRSFLCLLYGVSCSLFSITLCAEKENGLVLMTVATEATDGFLRFANTAQQYDYDLQVLGMGQKWQGGDIKTYPGGGQKVRLLREALEPLKNKSDLLVMFTDSYDVVLTGGPSDVVRAFKKFGAKILMSAEGFCWPDSSLATKYPDVKLNEKRFLNSGGFIGYATYIHKLLHQDEIKDDEDDQLYYTKIFLDKTKRTDLSIKLDSRSEIFQNLNGALDDVQVKFKGSTCYLYNRRTGNSPLVIHGNGPIKHHFNNLANYLADQWTPTTGCQRCADNSVSLKDVTHDDYPTVTMAIFFERASAFAEEFFNYVGNLDYPKEKITLFIHYEDNFHESDVKNFMDRFGVQYNRVHIYNPSHDLTEWAARNKAMELCLSKAADCQYFFTIDSEAQLENRRVLIELIERNRSVVAPLLSRPGKSWSNFWGSLNADGFYRRADDYLAIVNREQLGLWNVPYVTNVYLIHGYLIPKLVGAYGEGDEDADMAVCSRMRDLGIFMYVDNQNFYGHLVNNDNQTKEHLHNDLYQIFDNRYTWEKKYLHPDYYKALSEDSIVMQPCPDVYWFPMVTPTFCKHLVEEMEHLNQWSGGKHEDPRLAGGYENVPTVDTHASQIGWERHWLQILKDYISPMNAKVFPGYFSEARAIMNFVVRYQPTEQDRLRPHADASTYTVNGALNRPKIDYEGGGVRFLRYNCTITDMKQGWFLMHPGRLTHHHEGLPTTAGTRYIMVSFVDP